MSVDLDDPQAGYADGSRTLVQFAGHCLDCGSRMFEIDLLPAHCDCWDDPPDDFDIEPPSLETP